MELPSSSVQNVQQFDKTIRRIVSNQENEKTFGIVADGRSDILFCSDPRGDKGEQEVEAVRDGCRPRWRME